MAIPFITSTGLFTRLGRLAGLLRLHAANQAALNSRRHDTLDDVFGGRVDLLGTLPAVLQTGTVTPPNFVAAVTAAAQATLLDMVRADAPERGTDITSATAEAIRQMQAHAEPRQRFVPACTVSASLAASPVVPNPALANVGTGNVLITTRQPNGVQGENIFAEQARVSVIEDARTGATAGSETFQFVGSAPAGTLWGYDWPAGSGLTGQWSCCDPAADDQGTAVGQTALSNGGFDTWASGLPAGWTPGPAGNTTDVEQESVKIRRGTSSLGFLKNNSSVTQAVNATILQPSTAYGVTISARLPATLGSFTSVNLIIEALDSAGSVVVGSHGSNLSLTCAVVAADGLAWKTVTATWCTPRVPIASIRVRIANYTGDNPSSGEPFALVDDVAITPLYYPYPGGPGLASFAGVVNWVSGDGFEATIANDRGGALFGYTWQAVFDRFFQTRARSLYLPSGSAASTDIEDALIDTQPTI